MRLLLSFLLILPLNAQLSIERLSEQMQDKVSPELLAEVAQKQGNEEKVPNQEEGQGPENFRIELLGKLQFDRTPSGILKTQSETRRGISEKPEEESEEKTPTKDELLQRQYQEEAEQFQRDVVLSDWDQVRKFLADLPEELAKTTYQRLLTELGKPVQITPRPELMLMGAQPHEQANYLSTADILALADAAPDEPDSGTLENLAKLLPEEPGQSLFKALRSGTRYFGNDSPEARLRTSSFLLDGRIVAETADFLPDLETSRDSENIKALNVNARYHAEAHKTESKDQHLPLAWELSLEVMSHPEAAAIQRGEALYRALSLVPELDKGKGEDWLKETFADSSGEGFEILAAVGTLGSQAREIRDAGFRLQQMRLQHSAAEALLGTDGIDLAKWREILSIYALNWLTEADLTQRLDQSDSMRPQMQADNYGNIYYGPPQYYQSNDKEPNPIPAGEVIELAPSQKWITSVDETLALQLLEKIPGLFLKVKEHQKAFPFIEVLAEEKPDIATGLVRNLISVWADNHNPNQQNNYRSPYSYYYGYNNRAETIPLTRSKQERNLEELAELVATVRKLPLEETFNDEFAEAFITVHSQAEVWRLEALQTVFGELTQLDGDTIASLIEKMRTNLAALWPDPKLQEAYQTKRRDKEMHQQVLAGYGMARRVTSQALQNNSDSWRLRTQLAALSYEESNYLSSLEPQATHSTEKRKALDELAAAAGLYTETLPLDDRDDESTEVYETWFYAALGSPLLEALKNHHMPVTSEFTRIKTALDNLPEGIRERHYETFANTLNGRLANVSPDLKYRYLDAAMDVVGRHENIASATEVFDYYRDLVTEIELVATRDGSAEVGTEPFGLFVNLHHTQEIERESGGFQRYLQNQNNVSYSYNFGRPTEDYRDKFEEAARAALEEHFEVVSVTFHTDEIESRTSSRIGWRTTPYAYFLLRAKGPQVDTIPPLKIDLDFLDTSGHVVLPIRSANVPVVASATPKARPVRDLKVTMTLDERTAAEEKEWQLEIKANGKGLVPDLENLVDLPPEGFQVTATDDRQLQVEELTAETDDGAPLTTHEYRLTLRPEGGESPEQFVFPALTATAQKVLAEDDAVLRQRYQDVDLLPVGEIVPLEESARNSLWQWLVAGAILIIACAVWFWYRQTRRQPEETFVGGPEIPANLTAVSLLHWLKRLRDHVPQESEAELQQEISRFEENAFSESERQLDLVQIARTWQSRTNA